MKLTIYGLNQKVGMKTQQESSSPLFVRKIEAGDDISHHPHSAYFNVPLLAASTIALLA